MSWREFLHDLAVARPPIRAISRTPGAATRPCPGSQPADRRRREPVMGSTTRRRRRVTADHTALRMRISQALAGLSDDQRRVLRLRYLDGRPRAAVAAAMRRTVNAVRVLERQAVARLTANLADHTLATADSGAATPAVPARPA